MAKNTLEKMIETVNPATGEKLAAYPETSEEAAEAILEEAWKAFRRWRQSSFKERAECLKKAAFLLREKQNDYARLMALEMGKPVKQGRAECEKCAWVCDYYAENGEKFLAAEAVETDAEKSYVVFEPLGTVLAIMPWNFPFWQVFRAAAPVLTAGNALVLKHASITTGCALAIEKIMEESGFPAGLFRAVIMDNRRAQAFIKHPKIHAVTLTGSVRAGRAVASTAGEALKKLVLELGGSDPYLVLEDADLEEAVGICSYSRMINTGQSCIAAKRFVVAEKIRKAFEERLVESMRGHKMGDPLDESATMGPMARHDLRDELHRQVKNSVAKGAKLLLGGELPEGKGAYYPPTVLSGVRKGMPAFDEETFGPVAAVISARDEEEAVCLANESPFGLGAAVFTRDESKGERIAQKELEAGACFVNEYVRSDPRLPFGGIKESGYGRELGTYGIREFVNIKTVYIGGGTRSKGT